MTLRRTQNSIGCVMSLSEFVNIYFLLLNVYLQFCAVDYPHTCTYNCTYMFLYKYAQFCGDTYMHIYHENKHLMKVYWDINNSDTISFSSRRQSLTLQRRDRGGRRKWGRGAGGIQWVEQCATNSPLTQI